MGEVCLSNSPKGWHGARYSFDKTIHLEAMSAPIFLRILKRYQGHPLSQQHHPTPAIRAYIHELFQ